MSRDHKKTTREHRGVCEAYETWRGKQVETRLGNGEGGDYKTEVKRLRWETKREVREAVTGLGGRDEDAGK